MEYYPLFLDIKARPILIIGGGNIALEKIQNLLKAGAAITVISPEISTSIRRFNRRLTLIERPFEMSDISEKYLLIFAATGESTLNAAVSKECLGRRILCNTVDEPAFCHYIIPAILRRGAITVAVSTSGVSPFMAREIKDRLKQIVGPEYTVLSRILKKYRASIKARFNSFQERLAFWRGFFDSNPIQMIQDGERIAVEKKLTQNDLT
jgi:siroheme synthase-like protein